MKHTPDRMYHISQTQLSIARFSGGCIFNGANYIYIENDDSLVRSDIYKADMIAQKKWNAQEKAKWKAAKEELNSNVKQDWIEF
jgi:hypothetical protein